MNSNFVKRLLIILLLIVILILGVEVINRFINNQVESQTPSIIFNTVKLQDINSIEYILPDKNLKFIKQEGQWYVNNYPASERAVEVALSKLLALEANYIAGQDQGNFSIFEVNNDDSILILTTNNKTYKLYIGKLTFENGSFVRFNDSSVTYGTNVSVNSILDNDLGYFRDKSVTMIDQNTIESFSINSNQYSKINGQWYRNNLPIPYDSIKNLIVTLANIQGIAFADNGDYPEIDNQNSALSIKIKTDIKEYNFKYVNYKENLYILNSANPEYLIGLQSVMDQILAYDQSI